MSKLLSGVFMRLTSHDGSQQENSRKWWVSVFSLAAFTILLVSGLILLALNAHSGAGIQVVAGTFGVGFSMLFTSMYLKKKHPNRELLTRNNLIALIIVVVIIMGIFYPVGFVTYPTNPFGFWTVVLSGGLLLSAMLLLIYEGYPKLKIYGSPGLLTTAGFLMVIAIIYMTVIALWIVPYNPFTINVGGIREPPNPQFPLGTTSLGQDMLSRVIAGGATMLQVAILSVVICFSIGVPIGLLSSYRGGAVDRAMGLFMDSIFAFPGLILAIAISAMLGPGVVNMAIAIAVVYIPSYFRILRSQVFTVKELPYVEAAIVMGARNRDILLKYILPNALPSVIVIISINFADAILTAAGLTFVGLGLPIDIADWGWDLTLGWHLIPLRPSAWWVATFPGLMIVLLALGFTLTGEGLNEIMTPKLRE